jgi:lipooligosaccharide transport system permease protein
MIGFKNISYRVWYVWYRNLLSYQRFILPTFMASFGEPLLYLVAMGFGLGAYVGGINGQSYVQYIAPGLLVSSAMYAATYECTFGTLVRLTIEKIFHSQIVTPVSVEEVIAGEIFWGISRSLLSGVVIWIVVVVFRLVEIKTFFFYLYSWLLIGFFFASLATVIASYAQNFDSFTYYFELFITPMFFFSGLFFPLDNFPIIVQKIALLLPLTHAVNLSRAIIAHNYAVIIWSSIYLFVPALILFCWALRSMKKRLIN